MWTGFFEVYHLLCPVLTFANSYHVGLGWLLGPGGNRYLSVGKCSFNLFERSSYETPS